MKVAFDQQVFVLQEYGGISRYLCNLARQYASMPGVETRVIAPLHFNHNLAALEGVAGKGLLLPKVNTKVFRLVMETSKYLAHFAINRYRPDILHETYYSYDDYCPKGARRVLTVYDLIHERYGDMFVNSHRTAEPKKAAALRADHVICISESTRQDLIHYCGVPEEKTSVVYLGADVEFLAAGEREAAQDGGAPYVLYVGNRDGYKNFDAFVRAFAASAWLSGEMRIVCFGGPPLKPEEMALAQAQGLMPQQLSREAGGDAVLARLYRGAAALVYPSLYEGFGIPPLEAMAVGCPVICSNTSSLPEVVGNAGEYFDPNSEESMTSAMERVLQSPARHAELVALGREQLRKFSWERCAQETMDIYRRLL